MPWTPLSDRWASLPLVLAGPILRRVQPDLVTVWVVLKEYQAVTLLVLDTAGNTVLTGTRATSRLGVGCYVVAVTARPATEQAPRLQPGTLYRYNVVFGEFLQLRSSGVIADSYLRPGEPVSALGYGSEDALPSFSLPPADPANLRIIHGSCRRAQGDDRDALEGLDDMLRSSATDPDHRPHHLIVTGDQIYGDNVAEALLYEIIQANATLFGSQEFIPGPNVPANQLYPGARDAVVRQYAGQERADYTFHRSQLLALSEFLSLYFYSWSDVLWPARGNWIDQGTARGGAGVLRPPSGKTFWQRLGLPSADPAEDYKETIQRLEYLRDGLPAVRRALANVPTYMTFDDHDFTDSWSINYHWTRSVLDSAFGARHMRHALTAYAICQGWGNRPDDFEPGQPGAALLNAVMIWITTGGLDLEADVILRSLIGPSEPQPLPDKTYVLVPPVPGSALRWDFVLDFPSHRIISLDGRTHCGYPDDGQGFNAIIAPSAMPDQIPIEENPPPITFVVSGAPIVGYGFLEAGQEITAKLLWPTLGNAEEWVFNLPAQQSLLACLAHTGASGTTQAGLPGRRSRVVMLSGDVHYGYTARLQYWAERPYGHSSASPVDMVLVQLTCSAFKNERPATDSFHRDGLSAFEGPSIDRFSPGPRFVAEGLGWSNDGGADVQVGMRAQPFGAPDVPLRISGRDQVLYSSPNSEYAITEVTVPPDFAFRADWVMDPRFFTLDKPGETPVEDLQELKLTIEMQDPDDENVARALAFLDSMIDDRLARIAGASIVGRNQLGEITITWRDGEPVAVTHGIYWRELRVAEEAVTGVVSPLLPHTVTTVSLAFDEVERPF
jgi:hypothetical protein